jgi:hypothetical protein
MQSFSIVFFLALLALSYGFSPALSARRSIIAPLRMSSEVFIANLPFTFTEGELEEVVKAKAPRYDETLMLF